jgi:hypothetical protein
MVVCVALLKKWPLRFYLPLQPLRVNIFERQTRFVNRLASMDKLRVAVLFQALDSPVIHGVKKPRKPGGKSPTSLKAAELGHGGIAVLTNLMY